MNDYTARQQALAVRAQSVEDFWRAEYETIQARERTDLDALRTNYRNQKEVVEAELKALFLEMTNGVGLKEGDVIRVAGDWGDAKEGTYGIVVKQWRDTEREIDLVTCDFERGQLSLPFQYIYLVVDANEAARYRLERLTGNLKWRTGDVLLESLKDIASIATAWAERLADQHPASE